MTESAYIAPRLVLRVGVTGHRPNKLVGADPNRLADRARSVLHCLAESVGQLQAENDALREDAPFARCAPELRLATSIAEGADRIVAEAAVAEGYGLNLILPFPQTTYAGDFVGAAREDFDRLIKSKAVRSLTELDTGLPPRDPLAYQAAGRLMLAHSDVVIAIWNEKSASGPGGTEEIVTEARRRGLIVILITPSGDLKLWTVPETAADPVEDGRWDALTPDGSVDGSPALARRVRMQLAGPLSAVDDQPGASGKPAHAKHGTDHQHHGPPQPTAAEFLERFRGETLRPGSYHCGYQLLLWLFLPRTERRTLTFHVDYRLEQERRTAWVRSLNFAKVLTRPKAGAAVAGEPLDEAIDQSLRRRWMAADNLAVHYSTMFRSAFVGNFLLAALAVLVGLLTVFWEGKGHKTLFVIIELILIWRILTVAVRGRKERWRDRWLDYRTMAEALRPARLPMLIGSSPILLGGRNEDLLGKSWIAWYVRAAIREVQPPTATIDAKALRRAVSVAVIEEVSGQIRYHDKTAGRLRILDHRLEKAGDLMLKATLAAGLVYLVLYGVYRLWKIELPVKEFKPWATIIGGALPVLGAAIFGIRATADFRSVTQQSTRMASELRQLRAALIRQRTTLDRSTLHRLFGLVGQTMSDDLRVWNMIYGEQELTAGF